MPTERKRYNIVVEIPEKYTRDPQTGQAYILQQKEMLSFKRYLKDENEKESVMKETLDEYYTDWKIVSCSLDKTHPVKKEKTDEKTN